MKNSTLILLLLFFSFYQSVAQVRLQALNSPYTQHFDSLASTGTTNDISTLPRGWTFVESGTNANTTYAAGTGSSNTGNTYSFGSTAGDRALGGLLSGSITPTVGALFVNQTDGTITSLVIQYRGEQWRLGATGRADRLDFQYSTDAISLSSGTWVDVDALDFSSPAIAGTIGATNGNDSTYARRIASTINGLNIAPGASFAIRWQDFNATGADDGLAIDDFVIIPEGIPSNAPSLLALPEQLVFGEVPVGDARVLHYQVIGSNLTDSIAVTSDNPDFLIAADSTIFSSAVILPPAGGTIAVRFSTMINATVSGSITHRSTGLTKTVSVTGNGFDQVASIIPIAEARTRPVGTRVTVSGRITVANELGNPASLQDATGGIPVFDANLAATVAIGDSVLVTGPIGKFNDQVQFSGGGIIFTKVDSSSRMIEPITLTIQELAAHEGELVRVTGVQLVNKNFVFYPQSTEILTDGTSQVDLRIDGDTDIPGLDKPDGAIEVTAVVGRFRQNIQLLPRFSQDIPGLVAPTPVTDSIAASTTFDVVNWNLEFFGARREDYTEEYGPEDEALQLQNVKTVMQSLNADIIAVQEVSNDSLFAALVAQLPGYSYTCSDRFSYSFQPPSNTFPPQKLCFVFDTTTISVVGARALFVSRYDSARTIDPSLLPGYPSGDASSFYSSGRLPFALTVNARINGANEQITLINIHAKSGSTAADRNRRLYDAMVLKDSLDAHFADAKVIILGDLNDDLDRSITTGQATPYAAFVNDTLKYNPISKVLSDAGARSTVSFQDVIDHQIISNDLTDDYLEGSIQIIAPFRLIANYAATTSDHLAVKARYAFKVPEISFATASQSAAEKNASYTVVISLSEPFATAKQVNLSIAGTATYGKDFTTQPPSIQDNISLTIPAGSTQADFKVNVINDRDDELDEQAIFTVSGGEGFIAGSTATYSLTIQDDDVPAIAFTDILQTAREGEGAQQIVLKLSVPPATDQTITVQVLDGPGVDYGSDYTTSPPVQQRKIILDVPAGSKSVSFDATPLKDNKREFPELIAFNLASTSSGLFVGVPQISVFTILESKRQIHLAAFPNPTSAGITLNAQEIAPDEMFQGELRGPSGELLLKTTASFEKWNALVGSKIMQGKRGIYILTIKVDAESHLLRIVKQ